MEVKHVFAVLRRRKWIILQALIIVTLMAIGGTLLLTPIYDTTTTILVKKTGSGSQLSNIGLSTLSSLVTPAAPIEVNKVLVTSRANLNQVITTLQVRDPSGNLYTPDSLLKTSMLWSKIFPVPHIEVMQYQDTDLLQIKATSPSPQEAAMMANTLAEIAIAEKQSRVRQEYRSAHRFIAEQIKKVKAEYTQSLGRLRDYSIQEGTIDLSTEKKLAVEKIAQLLQQKEDNVIDLSEARAKKATLQRQLQQPGMEVVHTEENPHIALLKKDLVELRLQLAEASTRFTPEYPRLQELKQQIALVASQLQKELRVYQQASPELSTLDRQIAALTVHLDGVNADINKYLGLMQRLPARVFDLATLELGVTASQKTYSALLDYRYQIGLAEAITLSDIRMVEPAIVPRKPFSPNKLLNAILGVFLGALCGLGLAFLSEHLDDTIKSPEEVREHEEATLLGTIPSFRTTKLPFLNGQPSTDFVSEAYQTLRHNIKFASPDRAIRSQLLTSALPGEGKTTTVINLGSAISLAEHKKVLLIDADLRAPILHKLLRRPAAPGLTDVLVGDTTLSQAVVETDIDGLSLLPCGSITPSAIRVIESQKMQQVVQDAMAQYDLVMLDTPPLLALNDALILAGYVDACIVLFESGKATRHTITEVRQRLHHAHIEPLGIILNKLHAERNGYHHYSVYRYYQENPSSRNGHGRAHNTARTIVKSMKSVVSVLCLGMLFTEGKAHNAFRTLMERMKSIVSLLCLGLLLNGCAQSETAPHLRNLKSDNIVVKLAAIRYFGAEPKLPTRFVEIIHGSTTATSAVSTLLGLLTDTSLEVRLETIRTLGEIGKHTEIPVASLLDMLSVQHPTIRIQAIEALGKIKAKQAVPALLALVDVPQLQLAAIWALGNIGDTRALAKLEALLQSQDKYVRYNADRALRKIQ